MAKPDFIIVGAMKCGTSTLADQIAAQNGAFMTTPKEPNVFSDDEVFAKGPAWYSALFDTAAPGSIMGEASTHYTKLPTYPDTVKRLKSAVPEAKLIYVIRNPIDRAVSHYIHEWSERQVGKDIESALQSTPRIVDYGRYAYQIKPFLEAFGPDRVFLTSLEQLKSDPQAEFSRIAAFIGLEGAGWIEDLGASNTSANRIRTFPLRRLLVDNPIMRPLRQLLIPKSFRTWVWNQLTIKHRPDLSDAARAQLVDVYTQDRLELARLFPDHPALDMCYPFLRQ